MCLRRREAAHLRECRLIGRRAETKATEAAARAAWIAARREKAAAADEAGGGVVGTDSAIEHTQKETASACGSVGS